MVVEDGLDVLGRDMGIVIPVDDHDGPDRAAAQAVDRFEREFLSGVVRPALMPSFRSNSSTIAAPPRTWQAVPKQTVDDWFAFGLEGESFIERQNAENFARREAEMPGDGRDAMRAGYGRTRPGG